jgi:hypothetical protein
MMVDQGSFSTMRRATETPVQYRSRKPGPKGLTGTSHKFGSIVAEGQKSHATEFFAAVWRPSCGVIHKVGSVTCHCDVSHGGKLWRHASRLQIVARQSADDQKGAGKGCRSRYAPSTVDVSQCRQSSSQATPYSRLYSSRTSAGMTWRAYLALRVRQTGVFKGERGIFACVVPQWAARLGHVRSGQQSASSGVFFVAGNEPCIPLSRKGSPLCSLQLDTIAALGRADCLDASPNLRLVEELQRFAPDEVRAEPMRGLEWARDPEIRAGVKPYIADAGCTAQFLASRGVVLTSQAQALFLDFVVDKYVDALGLLERWARNDYSPDDKAQTFPKFEMRRQGPTGATAWELFTDWVKAAQPRASTVTRWRAVFKELDRQFPERAADSITPDEAQAWAVSLIGEGRTARTVADVWITAARRVCA